MGEDLLRTFIAQRLEASPGPVTHFEWHGGEPTLLGVDYFRKSVEIQRTYRPAGRTIANGMQTNGTLLDEEWGRFLAAEGFSVGLSLDGPREFHDRYRLARDGTSSFDAAMRGYRTALIDKGDFASGTSSKSSMRCCSPPHLPVTMARTFL
jgi:uncharacterized protein